MKAVKRSGNDRSQYYYQSLISLLEPDLGCGMAVTTLCQYCARLGIKENAIADEHIDRLASLLEGGLANFMGRTRIKSLIVQIKKIKKYDDWGII